MINLEQLIEAGRQEQASDIHLRDGMPVIFRRHGSLTAFGGVGVINHEDILAGVKSMLSKKDIQKKPMEEDIDFCYAAADGSRQRVNIFRQDGRLSVAMRLLNDHIPTLEELGLPAVLHQLASQPRGLVLVTGPTGSGKSTTLAAMIDEINRGRNCHILTLEDPVEYKYQMKKSLINQREIGVDADSFTSALRSALREDPDVILVGEMRDYETIGAAITAAETGHLVFSTLHTIGSANTVDRVIDVFPAEQQAQIRTQLASVLKGVVTQALLPRCDEQGRVAATEIMLVTEAIANLIRENKTHQINTALQTNAAAGMRTLNNSLAELVSRGMVFQETAFAASGDKNDLARQLKLSLQ